MQHWTSLPRVENATLDVHLGLKMDVQVLHWMAGGKKCLLTKFGDDRCSGRRNNLMTDNRRRTDSRTYGPRALYTEDFAGYGNAGMQQ